VQSFKGLHGGVEATVGEGWYVMKAVWACVGLSTTQNAVGKRRGIIAVQYSTVEPPAGVVPSMQQGLPAVLGSRLQKYSSADGQSISDP
jgi:hypothetical protein